MKLIDFSNCEYSNRHGTYGGQAGDKDGIIYNGEYWIIKYPKSVKLLNNIHDMSYISSPLSEYLGSHIYQILGYRTHKTELGIRNKKLVVGCKDFCEHRGELSEMRTLKNAANAELAEKLEQELNHSSTGDRVNLNELLLHLEHNPIIKQIPDIKCYMWEMIIVDILIGNNDRNNGNWGLLYNEKDNSYTLAPIYDNGNAFNNKTSDEKIKEYYNQEKIDEIACGNRTSYDYNGHTLSAKKILYINDHQLQFAIKKTVPNIIMNLNKIKDFIEAMPEELDGYNIISPERKNFYIDSIESRYKNILVPAYEHVLSMGKSSIEDTVSFLEKKRSLAESQNKVEHQYSNEMTI